MTCAQGTGCSRSSFMSRASAGGQLEQPSEVNKSARTGTSQANAAWAKKMPAQMLKGAACVCFILSSHHMCSVRVVGKLRNARRSYRVFRLDSWEEFLGHVIHPPYSNWAFRGERDERWPLYSSLSRYLQIAKVDARAWPEQESRMLRIFKRKAHQFLHQPPEPNDDFQWLAMTHDHRAPTALVDSPGAPCGGALVALGRVLH